MYKCEFCKEEKDGDFVTIDKIVGTEVVYFNHKLKSEKIKVCFDCFKNLNCSHPGCRQKPIKIDVENNLICSKHTMNAMVPCPSCGQIKKFRHVYLFACYPKIKNYFYKPRPIFMGEDTNLYIGVELEVGSATKIGLYNFMKDLGNHKKFVYLKSDRSIEDFGVEIVSHPATYNYHKNSDCWKNIFESLKTHRFPAEQHCGLHFHVNRSALTPKQISCIDAFMNTHDGFIENIAGRTGNSYCKKTVKQVQNWGSSQLYGDRYVRLNLENQRTIEFRVFSSTTDYDVFLKRIKFVKDLTDFCKDMNVTDILDKNHAIQKFELFQRQQQQ